MITVHHLNDSRSQRVLWLLEELSLPYTVKHYQRDPKTMLAPPELLAVHPLGKSPVISDVSDDSDDSGGDQPITVAETGAIVEYLIEQHGAGRLRPPAGTEARRRWHYWLHFAEGSAMPPLLMTLVFDRVAQAPVPFFLKPVTRGIAKQVMDTLVRPNLQRQLDFMEAELGRSTWFAGDAFSAADIMLSFPLEAAAQRAGLDARRPRLMAFLARIHARAAYQRALEKGGPYSFASAPRQGP